jgi:hypothetical protein
MKHEVVAAMAEISLTGDAAEAYQEYVAAARDLEGKFAAYTQAKERAQVALGKLTKTATGG